MLLVWRLKFVRIGSHEYRKKGPPWNGTRYGGTQIAASIKVSHIGHFVSLAVQDGDSDILSFMLILDEWLGGSTVFLQKYGLRFIVMKILYDYEWNGALMYEVVLLVPCVWAS